MNLYAFVHNSPLTHFDEYGLLDLGQWEKTSEQRHNEQYEMIWGASRWARSITSSAIHTAAFASQIMFGQPFGLANLASQLERSINRSISRFTAYIAPYQFENADCTRGKQIGYYGSEAISLALLAPAGIKFGNELWRACSNNKSFSQLISKGSNFFKLSATSSLSHDINNIPIFDDWAMMSGILRKASK